MSEQIVKQRTRGFICTNAHPEGCAQRVQQQIAIVEQLKPAGIAGPKKVLIIGSSTGYGLATRIATAWGFGAETLGVFYERPPQGKKTASAGYYNSVAFEHLARNRGLSASSINGDAFSTECKQQTIDQVRSKMGALDLVIYSLASPRRIHPATGEIYNSALKAIDVPYVGKTVDITHGTVDEVEIPTASDLEITATTAVMGGEDWRMWIDALRSENLLAEGARTLAYSYIGPELTWPIYRHGTIGVAKEHLEQTARSIHADLKTQFNGGAWVSVNKAVVTQASAAIPVVPLYLSLLLPVMKNKGIHEGVIEQMCRLAFNHLAEGCVVLTDSRNLIRLDDLEMREDVQAEVVQLWKKVSTENVEKISDIAGFRREFNNLFGFDVDGVDYDATTETEIFL
ncbi:MAG: enoyl-[acyl-carrier-protein] reductase FabV [Solibacterales bacterium]|nr:enoyl-[acyl-carrier-protein] reductase FabV [Bryobacterales bacterium]|tara:strand:+ start:6181 stop:7377 length:1197 start_codon:yes stop_codon:yes gene_type:complete